MANVLQLIVSAGGWAGFAASIVFNVIQHRRYMREQSARTAEKVEQRRREEEAERERRQKEQAPPQLYNYGGSPGRILISGKQHSVHGPLMDLWGIVIVVNSNQLPMKLGFVRLVLAGKDWPVANFFFRPYRQQDRFERISLTRNHKADYELHFMFPDKDFPQGEEGLSWFESDNGKEPFAV